MKTQSSKTVIFTSDLSTLSNEKKAERYIRLCTGFGLKPESYPFKLIRMQGREVLGCSKTFAQRLIKVYRSKALAQNKGA